MVNLMMLLISRIVYFRMKRKINLKLMFIIIPTYAQISSVKLISKLLRHVSVLIPHLQGIYKLCHLKS